MTDINRRNFLRSSLAGGAFLGFTGLINRLDRFNAYGADAFSTEKSLFGPLMPTASSNTGETFLALPAGYQYNVIGRAGSLMSNGMPTPTLHDGMAAFPYRGFPNSLALIRNHENSGFAGSGGAVTGTIPYDANAAGGTTTLIIDKQTRLVTNTFPSLSGTVRNCGGGPTPWNTWISCEETTVGTLGGFAKPHGYCFEVGRRLRGQSVALKQMGRFRHEAVGVDPVSGVVYLTEDNTPAGFYRYIPNFRGQLALGGQLQMLAVTGRPNADLRTGQTLNASIPVEWVNIADPDPALADTDAAAVYLQGAALGGAKFTRLEGCFARAGTIDFTSTNGGNHGLGQVWRYTHGADPSRATLALIFESPSSAVLDFPDNICFGPQNNMYICEDGSVDNYVRVLSPNGSLSDFAKNIVPGYESYEFAGCTFSPDGATLFVNIQTPGLTLAIWGNF